MTDLDNSCYKRLLVTLNHSLNIIKASMMRLIFSFHSLVAISYVYLIKQDEWYFVNIVGVVFLIIELFVTIIKRQGKEPRWFFPCFFLYISTMIPPIWIVELTRIDIANGRKHNNKNISANIELENILGLTKSLGLLNETIITADNVSLDINTIAVYLEISLMILVIMGRWFLPKGNISRSALSQLLLVYMSLASDEFDLLSLLSESNVQDSPTMCYITLSIFSWSLFQFSLNLIATRGRSFNSSPNQTNITFDRDLFDMDENEYGEADAEETLINKLNLYAMNSKNFLKNLKKMSANKNDTQNNNNNNNNTNTNNSNKCCMLNIEMLDTEVWSIIITIIFQDGPFLALRLTAVIKFNVRTFITMFFTCKNAIILFLQIYRLLAIYIETHHEQKADTAIASNKADAQASLNLAAINLDKYVLLSYTQKMLLKSKSSNLNRQMTKASLINNNNTFDSSTDGDYEKRVTSLSPIVVGTTLSRFHSYAIVLTHNYNLTVECCDCDCHIKEPYYV